MITIENVGPREPLPQIYTVEWIPTSEALPPRYSNRDYLCQDSYGTMMVLHWYDGWNCWSDGESINKMNEFKDIVAWMEIPAYESEVR